MINRASELTVYPACWTQSVAARDQQSQPVSPLSAEAKKFCAFGALGITVRACRGDYLAAPPRIEGVVGPLDLRILAHVLFAVAKHSLGSPEPSRADCITIRISSAPPAAALRAEAGVTFGGELSQIQPKERAI